MNDAPKGLPEPDTGRKYGAPHTSAHYTWNAPGFLHPFALEPKAELTFEVHGDETPGKYPAEEIPCWAEVKFYYDEAGYVLEGEYAFGAYSLAEAAKTVIERWNSANPKIPQGEAAE